MNRRQQRWPQTSQHTHLHLPRRPGKTKRSMTRRTVKLTYQMSAGTCIYYFKARGNDPKLRWASEEVKQIIITLHARGVTRPLSRGPSDRSSLSFSRRSWYTRWTHPTFYPTVLLMFPSAPRRRGVADPLLREEHCAPLKIYEQVRASAKVILVHFTHQWFDSVSWIFSHTEKKQWEEKRKPMLTPALVAAAACPDLPSSAEGPKRHKTVQVCLLP